MENNPHQALGGFSSWGTSLGILKRAQPEDTGQEPGPSRNITPFPLSWSLSPPLYSLFSLWGYITPICTASSPLGSGLIERRDHTLVFAQPGSLPSKLQSLLNEKMSGWEKQ